MKRAAAVLTIAMLAAGAARAAEVAGVTMPATETVEGKTLKLNGMGLRTKMVFKIYVAGLYLENPSRDAAVVVESEQIKSMHLSMLRDVQGHEITHAIGQGFARNARSQMGALQGRLDSLGAMLPNLARGDDVVLSYVPGKGTLVRVQGVDRGVIEGKDFADSLLRTWLGADPVQEDLKRAFLAGG